MAENGNYTPSFSVEAEIDITQGNGGGQTEDIASTESWLGQVKKRFDPSHQKWQASTNVCIYRVPKQMRISEPEVFDPFVVSLGPFHYKMNPKLSTMDEHKLEAINRTSKRLSMDVFELTEYIRLFEDEIRESYEEPIEWDPETLSWAFAMDACFILEFFKVSTETKKQNDRECFSLLFQNLPQQNSIYFSIMNDIMKMENQIPLFILIRLLEKELRTDEEAKRRLCFMLVASDLFEGFPFRSSFVSSEDLEPSIVKLREHVQKKPAHILDLYRMVIKDLLTPSSRESASHPQPDNTDAKSTSHTEPDNTRSDNTVAVPGNIKCHHSCCKWHIDMSCTRPTRSSDERKYTPCAELLQTAGIKFEPGQIGFRKRRFGKSTLTLPEIRVNNSTVTLLRNVMAYEECQRCSWDPQETVISHYLVLLEYLINSAKDVSVLRKARVISTLPCSDKDIACRFNNINQGITVGTYEGFEEVMEKARKHYDSQWNVWVSQFQEEHFSKPWYVVSLAVGILLLALTAVQAVYSVKN